MLGKYVSVGGAFAVFGAVLWASTTGCSGSTAAPATDAGTTSSSSSGGVDANASSSSSSSSGGDGGLPAGFLDPNTVPGVPVTFGTCPAFAKCDGSFVGSWNVTGGCLPDNTFDPYKSLCAGLSVGNVIIKASGPVGGGPAVVATATQINRQVSAFVQASLTIDKTNCEGLEIAGGASASCSSLEELLTINTGGGAHFDHANCGDGTAANTCACIAQVTVTDDASDDYTTDGKGTMTCTGTGSTSRTFDYCPAAGGTPITYQETTAKNPTFGMFFTIAKQ